MKFWRILLDFYYTHIVELLGIDSDVVVTEAWQRYKTYSVIVTTTSPEQCTNVYHDAYWRGGSDTYNWQWIQKTSCASQLRKSKKLSSNLLILRQGVLGFKCNLSIYLLVRTNEFNISHCLSVTVIHMVHVWVTWKTAVDGRRGWSSCRTQRWRVHRVDIQWCLLETMII